LIIHGGINHNGELNDTYFLNLENFTWKKVKTIGDICSSTEHTAEVYKDYMIVIGGEIKDDLHNKIRILNINDLKWKTYLPPQNNENIFMRIFPSSAIIGSKIFIYSGSDEKYFCYNDMIEIEFKDFEFENDKIYRLDNLEIIKYEEFDYGDKFFKKHFNENNFSKNSFLEKNRRYPYPRWGASMVVKNDNCLVLFGGRNKKDLNDLWIYCVEQRRWFEVYIILY